MIKEMWEKLYPLKKEYITSHDFKFIVIHAYKINGYYCTFHKTYNANGNSKFKTIWEKRKQNEVIR